MRRKGLASKRGIQPDPTFGDVRIAKFVNYIMRRGKKLVARGIVGMAFEKIAQETKEDPLKVFGRAIENVAPLLEVRPRRIGGATYQVPFEVKPARRFTLGAKWIIEAARARKGEAMEEKLASEITAAAKGEGLAVKRRAEMHKLAEANKAFAHYARF